MIENNRLVRNRPHLNQNDTIFEFTVDSLIFSELELPLGWHNQTEIIRIIEGEGEFIISGRTYKVRADSFVIINPNQIHSATAHIGRPLRYQSLKFLYSYFDNNETDEVFKNYVFPLRNGDSYLPNSIIHSFPIHKTVSEIFEQLDDINSSDRFTTIINTKVLMYQLLFTFYDNRFVYHKSSVPTKKNTSEDIVKNAINYIHSKYDEDFSLNLLAITFETSKPHLCRIFKRLTNQTITEYQNNHRIKHACEALVDSDDQVVKIAFDLGYSNISYFHSRFKLKTGLTPSEYRTIYKKG